MAKLESMTRDDLRRTLDEASGSILGTGPDINYPRYVAGSLGRPQQNSYYASPGAPPEPKTNMPVYGAPPIAGPALAPFGQGTGAPPAPRGYGPLSPRQAAPAFANPDDSVAGVIQGLRRTHKPYSSHYENMTSPDGSNFVLAQGEAAQMGYDPYHKASIPQTAGLAGAPPSPPTNTPDRPGPFGVVGDYLPGYLKREGRAVANDFMEGGLINIGKKGGMQLGGHLSEVTKLFDVGATGLFKGPQAGRDRADLYNNIVFPFWAGEQQQGLPSPSTKSLQTPGTTATQEAPAPGTTATAAPGTTATADPYAKYFTDKTAKQQALDYAAANGIEGDTEKDTIQAAIDARLQEKADFQERTGLDPNRRNGNVEEIARRMGVTPDMVRELYGRPKYGPATPAMDAYIAERNAMKRAVMNGEMTPEEFTKAQGGLRGKVLRGETGGGYAGGGSSAPSHMAAFSKIAGMDPANLRYESEKFAYQVSTQLGDLVSQAEAAGKLPANLKKQLARTGKKVQGLMGRNSNGQISKITKEELGPLVTGLQNHIKTSQARLDSAAKTTDIAIKQQNARLQQFYTAAKMEYMQKGQSGKGKANPASYSDLSKDMTRLEENEGVVPYAKGGALDKHARAEKELGEKWRSATYLSRAEVEWLEKAWQREGLDPKQK